MSGAPVVQAEDLKLARRALAKGLIKGHQLTEAQLTASKTGGKKGLVEALVEWKALPAARVAELKEDLRRHPPPAPPAGDPKAETRLGKIVLKVLCDKVLANDRYGVTYLGRLPKDPVPVALRLIDKGALRQGLWVDFLETVRAAVDVKHPNVVEVLSVERADTQFGIVTRYQKGGLLLADLLPRVGRLKLSEALRITRELAQGLVALHRAALVHRDVKPENVLLGAQGEVQLWNAGIVYEPDGAEQLVGARMVYGSPHTIAPECLKGEAGAPASDVYGLGVVAYELVTGVRPFEGEGLADLRRQHLDDEPIPPHKVLSALPKEVGELLVWMLAKRASERPDAPRLVDTLVGLERTIQRSGQTTKFQALDP